MKKRRIMLATSMLLAVLIVAGGTFAWFTASTEKVTNSFKVGTLGIELKEKFPGNCENPLNVNPGDCYTKKVWVCNTGTKRAVVRIEADAAFSDNLSLDVVNWNLNDKYWFEKDGYFVYRRVLAPGECTKNLFKNDKICFDGPNMGNDYMGATFDIDLTAHAIQASNNAPQEDGWGVKVKWDLWNGEYVGMRSADGEILDGPGLDELGDVIEID